MNHLITILLLLSLNLTGDYMQRAGMDYWQVSGFLMILVVAVYICYLVVGWSVKRNG